MTQHFAELMFTPQVKQVQKEQGSRNAYARLERPGSAPDMLTNREADFIATRDSFYMATVTETGWPYVQHRGGPAGFLKVIDPSTLGFADYRGNRQYVSVGNLRNDDRVALFLMDYPNQQRLKVLGHARTVDAGTDPELVAKLQDDYAAKVERGIIIKVEGYDWNCPQHITPRFTVAELDEALRPVRAKIEALEQENAALRRQIEAR